MSEQNQRLRPPPEQRFDPPQLEFNIESVAAKLLAEPTPANRRHRQETLYRHGALTIALFLFEEGGSLPRHAAGGVVTVQILDGRLKMTVEGRVHDLSAGSLLVLAPGEQHDLLALEPTRMLLTVCLDRQMQSQEKPMQARTTIDVRTIPGPQRHPLIFSTFDSLQTGEALEIVNDHDPVPLHNQFDMTKRGQFRWEYLKQGPELFRVRISRIAPPNQA